MRTIHRHRLEVADYQVVELPEGAQILAVADQTGAGTTVDLWVIVDDEAPTEERHIRIVGTGHQLTHAATGERHIGTVVSRDGGLVWHVFDLGDAT